MAAQSMEFTRRQVSRVRATAQAALAAPEGQHVALKTLAPETIAQCDTFTAADDAVLAAEEVVRKEGLESTAALTALSSLYDQMREVTAGKMGISFEAASRFRTPDDLLNIAEDLENTLERADPEWAAPVLAEYSPVLEAAEKEYSERAGALKSLQDTVINREQAEGQLRPVLVRFRRAVRATFGSRARQYREILDRRGRAGAPEDPAEDGNVPNSRSAGPTPQST